MNQIDTADIVKCDACGAFGIFDDEVNFFELPEGVDVNLCLDCGPEENYAELAPDA
jgi:hypothetical protein